jgi:hypothetical protein
VTNTISVSLNNNSPVCQGDVVFINASFIPGSSYAWSGPMGFTSSAQNPSLTQAAPGMSGFYTLTITQPGCTNPLTYQTQVTVSPAVNSIAITSNSPVCTGGNLGLSVTSLGGVLYSWSGPSGFTSSSWNNILSQVTTANGGQYSVTVSSPGCTPNTLFFDAVVYPTLNAVAGSNTPVCETGIVMLSAPFYPSATYAWSGPSGFSSQLQNPSLVNVVPQQSGVYSLTVDQPVCGISSTTVNVTISPNPLFVSRGSNSPLCQGSTLQLSSTTVSGLQYLWQGPGGFTSNSSSASIPGITVGQGGVYTLTVSSNGCVSLVDFLSVTVNSLYSVSAGAVTNPVCSGSSLYLTSNNLYLDRPVWFLF